MPASPITMLQSIPWDGTGVPVTVADASANSVAYTTKSGTITSGGVAQVLAAANAVRNGISIQNQSTGDLWVSFTTTAAVGTNTSMLLAAGVYFEAPASGVPVGAVSIIGATTSQSFYAVEW